MDIVERLRNADKNVPIRPSWEDQTLFGLAADHIEALRLDIAMLQKELDRLNVSRFCQKG